MKTPLFIFPFNGNALEALSFLGKEYEFIAFIDDDASKQENKSLPYKVYSREIIEELPKAKILAVPGSPTSYLNKKDIINSLTISQDRFATVIHPDAKISPFATIGYNVLIMTNAIITANAKIGNHVTILPNTVIHHDSIIEDYGTIGSNVTVAGRTIVKKNVYIGSGSTLINDIEIGENSLVGMGSNVINVVPANTKVAGNPAKPV